MKKQLVIVGITLVLLTVGLSGCETKQNKTQNEIELEGKIAFNSESSWDLLIIIFILLILMEQTKLE